MNNPNPNSLLTKATLLLVSTLTVMSGATIAPSLPAMQLQFSALPHVDLWVRLVLTIPALLIVVGSPFAGMIVDRLGRKPLLIGALLLYGLAGGSGLVLNSLFSILLGRAFLGLAVAGIMVSATTLIADYYIGAARATFMGLQTAFMGLGGVLFLSVGGVLADLNWRFPFLIYLLAWLLLPMAIAALYEPPRQAVSPSLAPSHTVSQPEQQATPPALPINLLVFVLGAALMTQIIFYLIPVQLPFYLGNLTRANATQSGLAIAFCVLFSAVSSMVYGRLKQRLEFIQILILSFALLGVGYVGIGLAHDYAQVLASLIPTGLGLGVLMPNLNVWVASAVPDVLRGRALAGVTSFFFLGQFLSPIVSQPIAQHLGLAATYSLAGGLLMILAALFLLTQQQLNRLIVP